ncbi:MAG: efflux RND transporter permease subunit [Chitinophagia bacterium]|jgi:predicted RND superfamily exporter protein
MWYRLGQNILKYKKTYLFFILLSTVVMGYFAAQIKLSYEYTKAIPSDNPKFIVYNEFVKKYGVDGTTVVVGFETDHFYSKDFFNQVDALHKTIKQNSAVAEVMSIPTAYTITKDSIDTKFNAAKIFNAPYTSDSLLLADQTVFENLPFYQNLLYNPDSNSYIMAISFIADSINSVSRTKIIGSIQDELDRFSQSAKTEVHISGLPFIRTIMADRIKKEMLWFLIGSLILSAITLLVFFRSVSATIMSLAVVLMGVIWSLGTMVLLGQKITLLTALIPPLIVVIGIPNCIYFLNKYHTSYKETNDKEKALVQMVGRMGVVTLFCNITAAIGFFVFALTKSPLLKEFGWVSGLNIMILFFISLFFIPPVLSYLPAPKSKHVRYLDNQYLERILIKIERWAFAHTKWVFGITILAIFVSLLGVLQIKKEAFIVDDLPKQDKLYTDLKWFEQHAGGVMPLEILVDTKKSNGLIRSIKPLEQIDEFNTFLLEQPELGKPLGLLEGIKFAKQAFYDGDSLSYTVPTGTEMAFIGPYFASAAPKEGVKPTGNNPAQLLSKFIDSAKRQTRISVNMKDIGSAQLPGLLQKIDSASVAIFDTAKYNVVITGSSVTFLEGSNFIVKGLGESIFWAFLLIAICMIFLFRSFPILICSLIPNIVPLFITAGIMGWTGVSLKPSTVLVFSVALGIAIDVTIRFLVNYKQELPHLNYQVHTTLVQTIKQTGISIIYTSLVLVAGFIIFCFSDFGGTKALGWLTSITLVVSTLTNLVLLPALIKSFIKSK